jgi:muramoyltetrapeptide carboxypeptidase
MTGGLRRPGPRAPDPADRPSLRDTGAQVEEVCRGGLARQTGPGPWPGRRRPPVVSPRYNPAAMIDRRAFARLLSVATAAATVTSSTTAAAPSRRIIKPKRLAAGDTVGLVLPASAAFEHDDISIAREQLELLGFKVVIGPHAYDRHGYFAGKDRDRADDLNRMFADDRIAGIFCYTGGWGSPRVLPYLDYDLIARKPKVLIGYSDITALLNAIHQRTGLVTFHGPVASSVFDVYTQENFRRVLMTPEPAGRLAAPAKKQDVLIDRANRILRVSPGKASGRLAGGNLTMLAALMGTPYEIDTRGAIVFLEDIREDLYRIDRMLTQLALGDKFNEMNGLVFGRCTDCNYKGPTFSLEDILRDRFGSLGKPALSGLAFGHIEQKMTLPVGVMATLDADSGTLTLDEAAVV